jgi:hypothetical protein
MSIALLFALFSDIIPLNAQELDFDSLYHNDEVYKHTISSLYDTIDVFEQDEIIKVTIESDFKSLVKNKYKNEYQPAVLRLKISDSVMLNHHINIRPRGNVRRSICYFPPLMLNFPKKDAVIKQFKEFDKMKMVVKCSKGKINEQYLLSEYYAYKLLNILSKYSFRVKLIEVTYIDTSDKYKTGTSYAYIIESIEELADRLDAIPFTYERISDKYININNLAVVYLFQYLIGNTDWSIPAGHNIKMIKSKDPCDMLPYAIPYDFDEAGIVNTHYAVPDASLSIESVRERVYRGLCIENEYIEHAANQFIQAKEKIYGLYENAVEFDKITIANTIEYIDEFYKIIETEFIFRRDILESCR